MKANELRIGNYIKDINHPERECRVFRLTSGSDYNIAYSYGKAYEDGYAHEYTNSLQPIPLTEEWFLKFGLRIGKIADLYPDSFIKDNVMESKLYFRPSYKGGYYWGFTTEGFMDGGQEREHEFYAVKPILYVHQLQNLYFVLTGEELTIREKW